MGMQKILRGTGWAVKRCIPPRDPLYIDVIVKADYYKRLQHFLHTRLRQPSVKLLAHGSPPGFPVG